MSWHRASGTLAVLLLLVGASPVAALVAPPEGAVLPDYDFRRESSSHATISKASTRGGPRIADARPKLRVPASEAQLIAVEELRSRLANLRIAFRESNGLPRQMHRFGQPLSDASAKSAAETARGFLRDYRELFRLTDREVDALVVARDADTHGVFRSVWLVQKVGGILVDHSAIRFTLDRENRLVWVSVGDIQPGMQVDTVPVLSPDQAIRLASESIGVSMRRLPRLRSSYGSGRLEYDPGPFLSAVVVEPMILPVRGARGVLTWRVVLEPAGPVAAWYAIDIDATRGVVRKRHNLYNYIADNHGLVFNGAYPDPVYGSDPNYTHGVTQSEQDFGYRWQSTAGWTIPGPYGSYQWTIGNNVDAKEDWAGDNETTVGIHADGGVNQRFEAPFLNTYATSTGADDGARIIDATQDVESVIANLFYWNNLWHDHMYELGWTEPYNNFQHDNFGRGGCGTDSVLADANDRAQPAVGNPALNNANFATPPEPLDCQGTFRPRMQQYLTRFPRGADTPSPTWLADTSLDSDVIIHEYSHGASNRLVGGPFIGCLGSIEGGAMGEGWGDWYATSYFDDPSMGEYSLPIYGPDAGVRCYRMDLNPRNYGDICTAPCSSTSCSVHADGEIHASTLWDMRQLVGRAVAEQLVTDALKITPCGPSFLDFRDALLMADSLRYGRAHWCNIWAAYSGRGMGWSATSDAGGNVTTDFSSFNPFCAGVAWIDYKSHWLDDVDGNGDGLLGIGETINLAVELRNITDFAWGRNVRVTVAAQTPGITMLVDTQSYADLGPLANGSNHVPFRFRVESTFLCGSPLDFDILIVWDPSVSNAASFTEAPGRIYPGWNGGSRPGLTLFEDDAEGVPLPLTAPFAVSTAHNVTVGGSQSYYSLSGCYAGDEPTCDGSSPCNDTCGTITLPAIALPAQTAAMLSFWATYNVEEGWEGPIVEVSTDGGATFTYLDTVNYTGDVPRQNPGCNPATDLLGINGPPGNGSLTGWTEFKGHLADYAGQTVIVRIANHQDGCVVFEGAYLDELAIESQACN